ncbi:MAG: cytochrome c [Bacteroidia bacterium]|nr:cytochrome c [Bacteroidia bacterium]
MKKFTLLFALIALISFSNCGDKKADKQIDKVTIQSGSDTNKEKPAMADAQLDGDAIIAKGKKLFKDKTCFTCHMPKETGIGPSIVDINNIYKEKNEDIVEFLKGNLEPIVDTDAGQVAVMKANLDGFVKDLKDDELNALKAYMLSVK